MAIPSGSATIAASRKAPYTRDAEATKWVSSIPLNASSLTPPNARSHIASPTSPGAGISR